MAEGNRKDPRARVLNMTVRYKSATVDEFIENHSHDISKGGIFIKTRSPFPAGTLLKFEVRIAEDQRLMQGVGRVVWRREPERAEENFPAGMGIKFIKTAEGASELISQIVAAREGAESSFDAGVRESGVSVSAPPPVSMPPLSGATNPNEAGRPTMPGPGGPDSERTPALTVESGPRSWPLEAETIVTSPPKKRPDQAPDKRKVVLQGSALENPASSKPAPPPAAPSAPEERAPSRARQGSSIAEETTSPRARPAMSGAPKRSTSPSVYGLVAILGIVALGVVVLNRSRSADTEEVAPPVSAAAPVPAAPPEPPPVAAPEPRAAEPTTVQAEPTTTVAAQEPPAISAPPTPAVAAPAPAPTPPPVAAVPPAKPASPPVVAAPVVARPAAAAKPKAPPAQPPSEGVAIIKPSDESLPPAASAEPPVTGTPSADKPPEKKKAAAAAPPQQAAPAPAAPPPATPPAASAPASDDNPY